jgi:hypothetical protein
MVIAVPLIVLGALGPIAAAQWRAGHWLDAARWIARNSSVHLLYATPMGGLFLACLGLSIIWPPAIVLVFLSAAAFMWALLASPRRGRASSSDQPATGRPATASREARAERRAEPGVSGPFSPPPQARPGADRAGGERRQSPPRPTSRPSPARRDARRAG